MRHIFALRFFLAKLPNLAPQILLAIFALFAPYSTIHSEEIQSKLVYVKSEVLEPKELRYIGEIVGVKYSVLVLEDAKIRSMGFLDSNGILIKNADSSWEQTEDGSLQNTIYFKIVDKKFAFPQIEVIVDSEDSSDSAVSSETLGEAIDLRANHKAFNGVVAQNLKVNNHSVKQFDEKNNIIILDLSAEWANLEDFKIAGFKKQGFESINEGISRSSGIYYVVLPNQVATVNFEYFDLNSQTYKQEHIKNAINKAQISINPEIAPINKVLIFKNIVILALSFVLFVAFLIRKIPFKIRVSLLVVGVLLLLFVVISVNINEKSSMKNDSYLRILPTTNSTIIAKIPVNAEVQIISRHNDYVKILTPDNKTGWVEKASVK